jgi:hypothetical protein
MALRLVTSDNDRAVAIRDHILPLLRERGTLEPQRDAVRLTMLRMDPWMFRHWTPFNELSPHEASSPGYRHAIERQHPRRDLSYGFEAWHSGARVLQMLWADDGRVQVPGFVRGDWEDAALAL